MKITKFEEIIAWQRAKDLTLAIYKHFSNLQDFGFRDQIRRAAVSIGNNIAEGFERHGNKELRHFLFIAKGSCAEVRSMLHIASELGYLNNAEFEKCYNDTLEIPKLLSGFIKTL